MGKIDKIGTKRRKFGKFWWKSPKKMRKKSKFNKHTVFNNRTGWIFSPKIINERWILDPKTISAQHTVLLFDTVEYVAK